MNNEYEQLENIVNSLQHALNNMKRGVQTQRIMTLKIELDYFNEKVRSLKNEIERIDNYEMSKR